MIDGGCCVVIPRNPGRRCKSIKIVGGATGVLSGVLRGCKPRRGVQTETGVHAPNPWVGEGAYLEVLILDETLSTSTKSVHPGLVFTMHW